MLQRLLDSVWFVSTALVGTLGFQQFANAQDADWRVFGFTDKLTLVHSVAVSPGPHSYGTSLTESP